LFVLYLFSTLSVGCVNFAFHLSASNFLPSPPNFFKPHQLRYYSGNENTSSKQDSLIWYLNSEFEKLTCFLDTEYGCLVASINSKESLSEEDKLILREDLHFKFRIRRADLFDSVNKQKAELIKRLKIFRLKEYNRVRKYTFSVTIPKQRALTESFVKQCWDEVSIIN
jgi:hypothetical protein